MEDNTTTESTLGTTLNKEMFSIGGVKVDLAHVILGGVALYAFTR